MLGLTQDTPGSSVCRLSSAMEEGLLRAHEEGRPNSGQGCLAREGVLENVASLESSMLSPGILNTCFCVEIRNTWALKTAHGSAFRSAEAP